MTIIYLDPVQLDATAGYVGEHAREIQDITGTLEAVCSADVPLTMSGWLAEELYDIAVQAHLVALLYTVAALETALRAQQIRADQSLVTAQPDLGTLATGSVVGGNSFSVGTVSGFATVMSIGGPSDIGVVSGVSMGQTTMTIGGTPTYAHDPLLAMASQVQDSNPALAAQLLGVSSGLSDSRNNIITNLLAPDGLSFVGSGTYEDEFGGSGGLGATYRDPRTGELRF